MPRASVGINPALLVSYSGAEPGPVGFPRVRDVWVDDGVVQCQVVEEVEHVLDGGRQDTTALGRAEDRLQQVVDVLLQCALQWCSHTSGVRGSGVRSRTFGRSGRWSNLPPFRLRFWKLESLFKV